MRAYKGFNADMTCRGFAFTEGETYEEPVAKVCSRGFHACTEPGDVLAYYHPSEGAVYHEVEVDDDAQTHDHDSKVASRRITIGARIDLMGLIRLHMGVVWERARKAHESSTGQHSSGYQSTAATSGDQSTAATSGDQSTAATAGYRSTAATSGYRSTAATSGGQSTAATSGDRSTAAVTGADSIAVAGGWECSASGAEGCWLVLTERDNDGHILAVKAVRVGSKTHGVRIKPGVLYTLSGGRVVAA